jgi:hypothetical protein
MRAREPDRSRGASVVLEVKSLIDFPRNAFGSVNVTVTVIQISVGTPSPSQRAGRF